MHQAEIGVDGVETRHALSLRTRAILSDRILLPVTRTAKGAVVRLFAAAIVISGNRGKSASLPALALAGLVSLDIDSIYLYTLISSKPYGIFWKKEPELNVLEAIQDND